MLSPRKKLLLALAGLEPPLALALRAIEPLLAEVVQARVYLTEFERDYAAMNATYKTYFEEGKLPARTCIGVTALAVGALVEIDVVAKR